MRATTLRGDFEEFLRAVRGGAAALDWSQWIAVSGTAAAYPQDWVAALQALSVEDQYSVLDLLRRDDAGPFADHLLLMTARSANEFEDPQVREFLLGDAQEAADRTLAFMDQSCEAVRNLVGQTAERSAGSVDVAKEAIRLEARLNELRISEIDTEYERVHDLEREIGRLEAKQRSLESYDRAERTRYREQLEQDSAALRAQRDAVESSVADAIAERDTTERAAAESSARLADVQAQVEELHSRQAADTARLAELSESLATHTAEANRLRAERHQQEAALAAEEQAIRTAREAIAQDAARLQQLRDSPAARSDQDITERVRELWQMLPADLSDPEFTIRRP